MPFKDPLTADTVLVRGAIQSPNYVPGVSGWIVRQNGSAEFSDLIARGTIVANEIKTSDLQTVPRLWVNNPGMGVDGPNTILFYKEDQNDATLIGDLARIQGNSFSGQNPGITIKAFGEVSDIDYTGVQIVGGTPGTGAGSVIELVSPDTVDIFSGGQNNGELGLRNNSFPVLDSHMMQLLGEFQCSAPLTLSAVNQDIAGCTTGAFNTNNPDARALVYGAFDFQTTVASGTAGAVCIGAISVDGTDVPNPLVLSNRTAINRDSASGLWVVPLPSAGSHTIKLRARFNGAGGAAQANVSQTNIAVLILDWPW